MEHLIIGAGPAGVVAAETLRKAAPADRVTIVGDEPGPPYSRMAIPYLLDGRIDESGTWLRKDPAHFERLGIAVRTGRAASGDVAARRGKLASGETLAFDHLLVATGSRPNRPPIPGLDRPGVHPCWTLEDARAIAARASKGKRVVQLGAGFIGCILLEALAARGVDLTVIEMGDRMVPRMMPAPASALIRTWCEAKGIRVVTGARVARIDEAGGALSVALGDGATFAADLVIGAMGVTPNTGWLEGSGVACDGGVLVDDRMASSVPGIYAAGDVSRAPEFGTDRRVAYAIQPTAVEQARAAALNMAGRNVAATGALAMNVLDTLGLVSASFGQWQGVTDGEPSRAERLDAAAHRYIRLEFGGDRLVGATTVGHTDHVGVLRGLIQGRVKLGPWHAKLLADPTRVVEAYLACAQGAD